MSFHTASTSDDIMGEWMPSGKGSKIKIFKGTIGATKGKYYGKIVWLKEPNDANGNPRVDVNNPIASKRTEPLMNLLILKGFEYDESDKEYNNGTIYDPKNGKTYSCYMTLKDKKLNVRGYIGISLIGRTDVWTKVED